VPSRIEKDAPATTGLVVSEARADGESHGNELFDCRIAVEVHSAA
jgi:hypothetical protein